MARGYQNIKVLYWDSAGENDKLTPEAILVDLFLITNRDSGQSGIQRAAMSTIAYCTKLTPEAVIDALKVLEGMVRVIRYPGDWVFLVEKWSHQDAKGPKQIRGLLTELSTVPRVAVEAFIIRYPEMQDRVKDTLSDTVPDTLLIPRDGFGSERKESREKREESESDSDAGARDTVPDTVSEQDDADDENASLWGEGEKLVKEIFPLLAKEKERLKSQVKAFMELGLMADYDLQTIRKVTTWAIQDQEFYRTRFISFTWLLDPGSEDLTHFQHMVRQYDIRGGGDGEPPKQFYKVGPYVCSKCGGKYYLRNVIDPDYKPKPTLQCGKCDDEWEAGSAALADDWTIKPLEDE